jgi:hypothetical protein
MIRGLASVVSFSVAIGALATAVACSKADDPGPQGVTRREAGAPQSPEQPAPVAQTGGTISVPTADGGTQTVPVDAGQSGGVTGISGPSFDVNTVTSIEGTFVTDQTPGLDGFPTSATVTWSFKIANISPPPSSTATWTAQATNVGGGNPSDYPAVYDLPVTLQASAAPAQWEFYGDDYGSPRNYVLVQTGEGKITGFYFFRRVIDDSEPTPVPDQPRNVTYTVK